MSKLTKTDVIAKLADVTGTSKAQAENFLNSFMELVTNTVKVGDEITLTGFGTFRRTRRNERQGVNPKTGAKITIPASFSVNFKVGKKLKDAVN